ncbi:MG2 domain-containing protein [Pedobacter sp. Du54]|uniref:MG2 domain-containing protein n=1 Tax=Pedobacter anseongensis TaxID=3133439 RepID=UPI0030A628B8
MIKIFNPIVFLIIGAFCLPALAQQNAAIADKNAIQLFFEKTYLQTDRAYYSSGENVWFSAFLVNGKSASLTSTSRTLYVELINPNSKIIDNQVIRLEGGLGKGDFKLNDTLQAGWYHIRAYTNWMRNFGDEFVFQKKIYITNAPKTVLKRTESQVKAKKTISFFPEGGNLVEGLTSIVAFKTNDEFGNGLASNASLISSKGDTVTSFQSTDFGMGIFSFTPLANEKYSVVGNFGAEKFRTDLPLALKKGLVMHLTSDSSAIKVSINTNELAFQELKGKPISIVIKHAGDNVYTGSLSLTKPDLSFRVSTKNLPAGLSILTLFDDLGRPNCERLFFVQSSDGVNFTVNSDKKSYAAREKVTLSIKSTDYKGSPAKASLSLAVVDGLITNDPTTMVGYLTLQSELKGEIKNAEHYFDLQNSARFKQLDLLLLTQGWREYLWRRLADSTIKIVYMPEPGITIKGSVKEKVGNKPLPNMNITLFSSGFIGDKIYATKTDASGKYFIDGLNWYGNEAIKISSRDGYGKKGGWLQIDTSFKPMPIHLKVPNAFSISPSLEAEMTKRSAYNKSYKKGDSILLEEVTITGAAKRVELFDQSLMTFGYKDQVFNITSADYSYKGLEHWLLTKIQGAFPLDDGDSTGNEGIAFLSSGKKVRPALIINNKQDIQNRLDYYSLTMDQINQVVVKHLVTAGPSAPADAYVIYLNLKETALLGQNLNLLNLNLKGYYSARSFYSPNYTSISPPIKDLRTTIFWAPLLKTNDNGELSVSFFNGDNTGEMTIKTNGITSNGVAVVAKSTYKVQ